MRYVASFIGIAAFAAVMLVSSVSVQAAESELGNVDNGRKIFTEGKGDAVPACNSCHGMNGLGDDTMGTPRLANQVFTYEVKQLDDFAAGRRTDNTLQAMNGVANGLTQQDRRDVSAFVHTLRAPFAGSNLNQLKADGTTTNVNIPIGGDRSRGRMIVEFGLDGIPACKSCHGFHGRSAGRMFPVLTGQRYVYLVNQLAYWRNGAEGKQPGRANDPMRMMEHVAVKLSDKDIQDVASFLTGAVPYTPGNPHPLPREQY